MTTPQKNDDNNHKRPSSRATTHPHHSPGQSFDIIPRSQVRPTVTARPVLTPTAPEQVDNTLQSSSQAASSPLIHGSGGLALAPTAPEVPDGLEGSTSNNEDILDEVNATAAEATKSKVKHELKLTPPDSMSSEEASQPADASTPNDSPTAATEAETATKQELSELVETTKEPESPLVEDVPVEDQEETQPSSGSATESPLSKDPEDGSIDHIFKDDTQTIEHSQALKDELQTLKDKPEEEIHPHHELYGGKPVIVIHKARGVQSTLNWILWFIFCLLLALVIVDVLLDAGIITTDYSVPHTHLFQ